MVKIGPIGEEKNMCGAAIVIGRVQCTPLIRDADTGVQENLIIDPYFPTHKPGFTVDFLT